MKEGLPSRTALKVAMRRAAHQLLDNPKVFEDPLALSVIGPEAAAEVATGSGSLASSQLRAFMAVRSRYAEDQLHHAAETGVRQYVVLGAGLDTFAYRNPYQHLRVFEVDSPATQEWKLHRLQRAGIAVPDSLTFVPLDFEKQTLLDGLTQAGFHPASSSFFSWLGVVPYLNPHTVIETLKLIASMSSGNGVVFDYAVPRSSLNWMGRLALDALAARVKAAGEPFQSFFEPQQLAGELRACGFRYLEDLGPDEINARYFTARSDGLRIASDLARLMFARS